MMDFSYYYWGVHWQARYIACFFSGQVSTVYLTSAFPDPSCFDRMPSIIMYPSLIKTSHGWLCARAVNHRSSEQTPWQGRLLTSQAWGAAATVPPVMTMLSADDPQWKKTLGIQTNCKCIFRNVCSWLMQSSHSMLTGACWARSRHSGKAAVIKN